MPEVQRAGCVTSHKAGNTVRLHSVVCPGFLISESFLIRCVSGEHDFFLFYRLFAKVGKLWYIVVQTVLSAPEAFKALLIAPIVSHARNTNYKTVFFKALGERAFSNRRYGYCTGFTEGCAVFVLLAAGLNNLIDVDLVSAASFN